MAHHDKIFKEGRQADRAGRVAEAALLYRSAASAALEFGDRAAWFKSMVQAATSTSEKGDMRTSLALLLEARQEEPEDPPQWEAWLARRELFIITAATRPERVRLEQLIADLRLYAKTHRDRANEVLQLEGYLASLCGDWRTALAYSETVWQDNNGHGKRNSYAAYLASEFCLQLGQVAASRDWISALDQCEEESVPRWSAEATLRLAFAEGQPFATLLSHLRIYTDRTADVQRADTSDIIRELFARTHLLDPHAGDPAAHFHPTCAELRRPLKSRQDVHRRYSTRMLHLDYHLACLRHTASVPAVDDYYYYQSQQVPTHLTPADLNQFQRRLHKARASAQSTFRYARRLDTLLECDYYEHEVQDRCKRIEEIAQAAD
ncbi:MAG: hypothetical protein ACJ76Y_07285 [Thermoanaerobaculia bacterium]